jgi:hypothetical protein
MNNKALITIKSITSESTKEQQEKNPTNLSRFDNW